MVRANRRNRIHLPRTRTSLQFGPEQIKYAVRASDLRRFGATVVLGADWMVAPFDLRFGMTWARLRRRPGHPERPPTKPSQDLTPLETIEGFATHAALAVSEEHISGQVKAGYRADLTAFAEDPEDCDVENLVDLPTLMTMVDEEVVYGGN